MAILRRLSPCRHKGLVEGSVIAIVEIIPSDELVKGGDGFWPVRQTPFETVPWLVRGASSGVTTRDAPQTRGPPPPRTR